MYWTNNNSMAASSDGGSVMRVAFDGGEPVTLAPRQRFPDGIAVDATAVYWANNIGTIEKLPHCGGTPVTIASEETEPEGIAVDATGVYWANANLGTIMKVTPK